MELQPICFAAPHQEPHEHAPVGSHRWTCWTWALESGLGGAQGEEQRQDRALDESTACSDDGTGLQRYMCSAAPATPLPPSVKTVMCACQMPAERLTVKKPGPTRGRHFYRCALKVCEFFQWDVEEIVLLQQSLNQQLPQLPQGPSSSTGPARESTPQGRIGSEGEGDQPEGRRTSHGTGGAWPRTA